MKMKLLLVLTILAFISASNTDCRNKNKETRYQGKLEIKGICSNYTISLQSGEIDSAQIEKNWTDENTGRLYKNVFALGNPCQFPKDIAQGDTFYFVLDSSTQEPCMVCEAYYPKPAKKLNIKVVKP
jgi:hypothetical protein